MNTNKFVSFQMPMILYLLAQQECKNRSISMSKYIRCLIYEDLKNNINGVHLCSDTVKQIVLLYENGKHKSSLKNLKKIGIEEKQSLCNEHSHCCCSYNLLSFYSCTRRDMCCFNANIHFKVQKHKG